MDPSELASRYREYIDCLNQQAWEKLGDFVDGSVRHNGRDLGVAGYRQMIERDCRAIPDLSYNIDLLVCEGSMVASRLLFDCSPRGTFLGVVVNGRRVTFAENVIYRYEDGRIREVWSVVDKAAIEEQLPVAS